MAEHKNDWKLIFKIAGLFAVGYIILFFVTRILRLGSGMLLLGSGLMFILGFLLPILVGFLVAKYTDRNRVIQAGIAAIMYGVFAALANAIAYPIFMGRSISFSSILLNLVGVVGALINFIWGIIGGVIATKVYPKEELKERKVATKQKQHIKKCKKCGTMNTTEAFCKKCGEPL